MSKNWAPAKFNKRVMVAKTNLTPGSAGGFLRKYEIVATLWASLLPLSFRQSEAMYVGNSQVEEKPTHEVIMRKDASAGVSFLGDDPNLGSHRFIIWAISTERYRIFRIHKSSDVEERNVFVRLLVEEIEQQSSESLIS